MGGNREKFNISIAILEKLPFWKGNKMISHFDGSNNIFADWIYSNDLISRFKAMLSAYIMYMCNFYFILLCQKQNFKESIKCFTYLMLKKKYLSICIQSGNICEIVLYKLLQFLCNL
jgi:hypothetical protein